MTNFSDVLGAGAGGPLAIPSPWTIFPGYLQWAEGIVIGSPSGGNMGNGSINVQTLYVNGTQVTIQNYLPLAGGTLTGDLVLYGSAPLTSQSAAPKAYVDARQWQPAPNDGSLYGQKSLAWAKVPIQADAPSDGNPYVRVNGAWSTAVNISAAPVDGTTYGVLNGAWANTYDGNGGTKLGILRYTSSGLRPPNTTNAGAPYVNFADGQIGVINAAGAAIDICAARFYSTTGGYNVGDVVFQAGSLYRCQTAIAAPAGNFVAGNWSPYLTAASISATYLPLAGGTLTGPLNLSNGAITVHGSGAIIETYDRGNSGGNTAQAFGIYRDANNGYIWDSAWGNAMQFTPSTLTTYTPWSLSINLSANVSYPFTLQTQNGYNCGIIYTVSGVRQWIAGCFNDGGWGIYDNSAAIWRERYLADGTGYINALMWIGDSGRFADASLCVSTIGGRQSAMACYGSSGTALQCQVNSTGVWLATYNYGAAQVGNINTNGSQCFYTSASDRRLKEDVHPLIEEFDVGGLLDRVSPVAFTWKASGEKGYGFIAQDLYNVVPDVVTPGAPDDGELAEDSQPWGVDPAKLVPYLVAEIQALRRRVAALEAR